MSVTHSWIGEGQKILTLDEIAAKTGMPKATIRFYRATGKGFKTFKIGSRVVALESDVSAWLQAQYDASTTVKAS